MSSNAVGYSVARALLRISRRLDKSRFRSVALTSLCERGPLSQKHRSLLTSMLDSDKEQSSPLVRAWREGLESDQGRQGTLLTQSTVGLNVPFAGAEALDEGFGAMQCGFELIAAVELAEALSPTPSMALDEGATLMGQLGGDLESVSNVCATVDTIADAVRESMERQTVPAEAWVPTAANRLLTEEEPERSHHAMLTLYHVNKVLYQAWGFHGNSLDYYEPKNSFLGAVIRQRCGIPISMAALYSGVLRRLGIKSSGTRFPGHFLLRVPGQSQNLLFEQTLLGDWTARYGPNGPEVVRVMRAADGGLEAIKLTGDANVPAGQVSWRSPAVQVGGTVSGDLQLADNHFSRPRFESVKVHVESSECITVQHEQGMEPLLFERISPSAPLFIDTFNSGTIMTKEQCLYTLNKNKPRTGAHTDQVEGFIEPVESHEVFARMARNLVICYSQRKEIELAKQWDVVASCLTLESMLRLGLDEHGVRDE